MSRGQTTSYHYSHLDWPHHGSGTAYLSVPQFAYQSLQQQDLEVVSIIFAVDMIICGSQSLVSATGTASLSKRMNHDGERAGSADSHDSADRELSLCTRAQLLFSFLL